MTTAEPQLLSKVAERLEADEIHVWRMPYRREQGRAPFLHVLAAYLRIPAETIRLVANAYGRPELAPEHAQALGFNWSHSGDAAIMAIARQLQPGVDIERHRPRPRAIEIAERYFDPTETAALAALSPTLRSARFLELWTAKEAVLKALGRGLAFGLERLQIDVDLNQPRLRRFEGEDVAQWQLQRLMLDDEHVGALAWRGGARRLRLGTLAALP